VTKIKKFYANDESFGLWPNNMIIDYWREPGAAFTALLFLRNLRIGAMGRVTLELIRLIHKLRRN
jgi:hypothetical protein